MAVCEIVTNLVGNSDLHIFSHFEQVLCKYISPSTYNFAMKKVVLLIAFCFFPVIMIADVTGPTDNTNPLDPQEVGYDFKKGGIYYKIRTTAEPEVTTSEGDSPYIGDIVIPDEVSYGGKTYKVTKVSGFANSPEVTSVTIPRYVRRVSAFYGASSSWWNPSFIKSPRKESEVTIQSKLKKVTFNAEKCDTAYYELYPLSSFAWCGHKAVFPNTVNSFTFGETVTKLPRHLLRDLCALTSLVIPRGVKMIDWNIIKEDSDNINSLTLNCADLEEMNWMPVQGHSCIIYGPEFATLPRGVLTQNIENQTYNVPSFIKRIPSECFQYQNVKNVVLNEGLEEIGDRAFQYTSVKDIRLPSTLKCIGKDAFNLDRLIINSDLSQIGNKCVGSPYYVEFADNATTVPSDLLYSNKSLTEVVLGRNVKHIEEMALACCDALTDICLPEGLETIGEHAFFQTPLTELYVPKGIKSIGTYGAQAKKVVYEGFPNNTTSEFVCATNAEEVVFLAGCKYIPNQIAANNLILRQVVIDDSIEEICDSAFFGAPVNYISFPSGLKRVGEMAFFYNELDTINLPVGIQYIGESAFGGPNITENVVIPSSVSHIGNYSFHAKGIYLDVDVLEQVDRLFGTDLEIVTFGPNCSVIPKKMFYGNAKLSEVHLGTSITSVGSGAFSYCTGLTNVSVDVRDIQDIFTQCGHIGNVILGTNVRSINNAFNGTEVDKMTICSDIENGDLGATRIGLLKFSEGVTRVCDGLASREIGDVELAQSITVLGNYALAGYKPQTVEIPINITSYSSSIGLENAIRIVWNARNCASQLILPGDLYLASFEIGEDVEILPCIRNPYSDKAVINKLQYNAIDAKFKDLSWDPRCYMETVRSVEFGDNVKSLPENFLQNSTYLEEVSLPSSLEYFPVTAFEYCNLSKVESRAIIPPAIMPIPGPQDNPVIFKNCHDRADLIVPVGSADKYRQAYGWKYFYSVREDGNLNDSSVGNVDLEMPFCIIDKTLSIGDVTVCVFNTKGDLIFEGSGEIELQNGVYIVVDTSKSKSSKILIH